MTLNLNFHDSFAPEREAISKLLDLASQNPAPLSKEEISEITTIPTGKSTGKVVPHIKYCTNMGLLVNEVNQQKGYGLKLTDLGVIVRKEDSYLLEKLTLFLCHYFLVAKGTQASLWEFIFRDCIPHWGTLIKNDQLVEAAKKHFQKNSINFSPVRTFYTSTKSFGDLDLVEISTDTWKFKIHGVQSSYKYLYSYQLLRLWELFFEDDTEISLPAITTELKWGSPYLWDESRTIEALELLSDLGVVSINRQLSPMSIIRQAKSAELLPKIYSLIL